MPDKTITLTPIQAQRLIDTYCYVTEPDAVERLTRRAAIAWSLGDVYGEPVSWLSQDEIDALVYGR